MTMKDFKVKMKYDLHEFEKKAQELMNDISSQSEEILKRSTVAFVNAAAKWTPPRKNGPSMTIPKEKYERPFVVLSKLIAGEYDGLTANEIDKIQFRNGMRFKIFNTRKHKETHAPAYAYCKTKGELKKLRRIAHRGLAKVMWGKSLDQIGMNVPIGIQRLINKSPALANLNYSSTEFNSEEGKATVTIKNDATDVEKYARNAEQYGYKSAMAYLRNALTALAKKGQTL